jgi:hypothetical protein
MKISEPEKPIAFIGRFQKSPLSKDFLLKRPGKDDHFSSTSTTKVVQKPRTFSESQKGFPLLQ